MDWLCFFFAAFDSSYSWKEEETEGSTKSNFYGWTYASIKFFCWHWGVHSSGLSTLSINVSNIIMLAGFQDLHVAYVYLEVIAQIVAEKNEYASIVAFWVILEVQL